MSISALGPYGPLNNPIIALKKLSNGPAKITGTAFEDFYLQTACKAECIDQLVVKNKKGQGSSALQASSDAAAIHANSRASDSPSPTGDAFLALAAETIVPGGVPKAPQATAVPLIKAGLGLSLAPNHGFVKTMLPYAQQAAKVLGLDPLVLIAQAALETGWGKHMVTDATGKSSYNLFNIKSTDTRLPSAVVKTQEYIDQRPVKQQANFKIYTDIAESFHDYVHFITGNPRYQQALSQVERPFHYLQALQDAGYATDPTYAHKIYAIYNRLVQS